MAENTAEIYARPSGKQLEKKLHLIERIHELEAAYRRLKHLDSEKDVFLATLSHELKTPLTAIIGWVGIAREQANSGLTDQALEIIERNAQRQLHMIEDMLTYTDCIEKRLQLQHAPVNLRQVCEEAAAAVLSLAGGATATLEVAIPKELTLFADRTCVRRILQHLLSNAFKFTPSDGMVFVRADEQDNWVELEVSDTGIGIDQDSIDSVCNIFWQADMSATRRYRGAGVGLALVKELVALHGGTLLIESEGPDQGTRLIVYLPKNGATPGE